MYNLATATAWILLDAFGTVRLTVCLSSSVRIDGILGRFYAVARGGWMGRK